MNLSQTCFTLFAALAGAVAGRAQDVVTVEDEAAVGWKSLSGQEPFAISATTWLNTGDEVPTPESLRGKVWMLEFFATWCGPCMAKVEHLAKLHAKYADVGFRIVAISSEPVETVRRKMIEGFGVKYWIGSDPKDETIKRYTGKGAVGIPHCYLIGADGKVIGDSFPTESQLRELLESGYRVDKPLHEKLSRARTAYDAGAFGAAHRLAVPLRKDADAAVAADATLLCTKVAGHAEFLQKLLIADVDDDANERYGELLRFAFQYDGLPPAHWALTQLADLKKNDRVKSFLPEWAKLENALRTEMLAEGRPEKLRQAKKLYDEAAQKYARSLVGRLAADASTRLATGK